MYVSSPNWIFDQVKVVTTNSRAKINANYISPESEWKPFGSLLSFIHILVAYFHFPFTMMRLDLGRNKGPCDYSKFASCTSYRKSFRSKQVPCSHNNTTVWVHILYIVNKSPTSQAVCYFWHLRVLHDHVSSIVDPRHTCTPERLETLDGTIDHNQMVQNIMHTHSRVIQKVKDSF